MVVFTQDLCEHGIMLAIADKLLPQSAISYLAFRVSFHETLERMALAQQFGTADDEQFGFLTEVPFLQTVPPHVQLDLLAETWNKHLVDEELEATLVDESIVYAACETTARLVEQAPDVVRLYMECGPSKVDLQVDDALAAELRDLHLHMPNEGDFLLISQFEDMPPRQAQKLKRQYRLDPLRLDTMFEILGRWYISVELVERLHGLLTHREVIRAVAVIAGRSGQPSH